MYKRIDDILRLFRTQPHAQVPFALECAVEPLFDRTAEYFSFEFRGHTILSRFACLETYLVDCSRIELFPLVKVFFSKPDSVTADDKRLLEQVQLSEGGRPYLPNLNSILTTVQRELSEFHAKLQEEYGSIQFGERFKCCDLTVQESRDSVFRYEGAFQYGAQWSIANAWEHRYYVVSGENWTLVTCQEW